MANHRQDQSAPADSRRKGKWVPWVRVGVSLIILALVLRWVGLDKFQTTLSRLDWELLLLAFFFLFLALILLRSARLWVLLRSRESPFSFWKTFRIQWASGIFHLLAPGTLGADAWRIWAVSRRDRRMNAAFATVAVDRVAGMIGQTLNVLLAWIVFRGALLRPEAADLLIDTGVFCILLIGGLGLLSTQRVTEGLTRLPLLRRPRIKKTLRGLQENLLLLMRHPRNLPWVLGTSTVGHLFNILAVFVLARGLGAEAEFGFFLALIPVAMMASGLPISITGLGVRDLTYVSLSQPLGIPPEIMLTVAVTEFVLTTILRLCGGIFFILPVRFDPGGDSFFRRWVPSPGSPDNLSESRPPEPYGISNATSESCDSSTQVDGLWGRADNEG